MGCSLVGSTTTRLTSSPAGIFPVWATLAQSIRHTFLKQPEDVQKCQSQLSRRSLKALARLAQVRRYVKQAPVFEDRIAVRHTGDNNRRPGGRGGPDLRRGRSSCHSTGMVSGSRINRAKRSLTMEWPAPHCHHACGWRYMCGVKESFDRRIRCLHFRREPNRLSRKACRIASAWRGQDLPVAARPPTPRPRRTA